MNLKILVCFTLLLGGCVSITHHGSGAFNVGPGNADGQQSATSPPAVLSATVIECIYQQGCHPVTP